MRSIVGYTTVCNGAQYCGSFEPVTDDPIGFGIGGAKGYYRGDRLFYVFDPQQKPSADVKEMYLFFDVGTGGEPRPSQQPVNPGPAFAKDGIPVVVQVTNCTNTTYPSCDSQNSTVCLEEDPVGKTCDVIHEFQHYGNGTGQWIPTPTVFPLNIVFSINKPCQNCNNAGITFAKNGVSLQY